MLPKIHLVKIGGKQNSCICGRISFSDAFSPLNGLRNTVQEVGKRVAGHWRGWTQRWEVRATCPNFPRLASLNLALMGPLEIQSYGNWLRTLGTGSQVGERWQKKLFGMMLGVAQVPLSEPGCPWGRQVGQRHDMNTSLRRKRVSLTSLPEDGCILST